MIKVLLKNSQEMRSFSLSEFEKLMGIKWLDQLRFQKAIVKADVIKHSQKAMRKKELDFREKWLGVYYDNEIKKGFIPKISIRWIGDRFGYGVFAEEEIPKGRYIGEYVGEVRKRRRLKDKKNFYTFEYTIGDWIRNPYIIDAKDLGNHTRFINHSDDANLKTASVYTDGVMHIVFVSTKAIRCGEQLCYHYGDYFWTKRMAPQKLENREALDHTT